MKPMSAKPVIVYGASGYPGRLIMEPNLTVHR